MSDDEDQIVSEEEMAPPESSGPSEAELAMQRRKEKVSSADLDEALQEMLEANKQERMHMEEEIRELRARSEKRKREREEEERRLNEKRAEEDAARKALEEERKRKKEEEENKRREDRAKKMAEFEKYKNPPKPNFVITKRADGLADEGEDDKDTERKSREQLEAERRAILQQRIQPLEISGFNESKLAEKAKELHKDIYRLEAEKYDLEKRFKEQQYDMMELAERARQMNKVGKGGLKRVQLGADEVDKIQDRFAGAPAKIEMYSKYERQKDKRAYQERQNIFSGSMYAYPPDRIKPKRKIEWEELTNTMCYSGDAPAEPEPEPAPVAAEGEE